MTGGVAIGEGCASCVFAQDLGKDGFACRRNPPAPLVIMMQVPPTPANQAGVLTTIQGQFPPVRADTWCGEYQRKATTPN